MVMCGKGRGDAPASTVGLPPGASTYFQHPGWPWLPQQLLSRTTFRNMLRAATPEFFRQGRSSARFLKKARIDASIASRCSRPVSSRPQSSRISLTMLTSLFPSPVVRDVGRAIRGLSVWNLAAAALL